MNIRCTLGASAALLWLGACAAAPTTTSRYGDLRPESLPASATPAGAATAAAVARPAAAAAPASLQPVQDYSPSGLFGEAHGDFMATMDRYRPAIRSSVLVEPGASLDGEPGRFDLLRLDVGGRVPIVLDPDSVVLFGAQASGRRYELNSRSRARDETVGSVGLELGYGRFVDDDNYAYALFEPGIYSDFDGTLHRQDWQFHGEGVLVHRYRDDLFLKAGVRVAEDFRELPVYPMAGFSWLIDDQWRIDVMAPRQAEISFQPQTPTTLFAGFELEGERYRVRAPADQGKVASDLHAQEMRLYAGGVHRFDDHLSAFGRLGCAVGGDHRLLGPSGQRVEGQLDPTVFFELGAGWDF